MAYNIPADLQYTQSHEWIRIEGDEATVGITDYAQHSLGDIVFAELPEPGTPYEADAPFGSIESVKAVSDLIMPVNGTVVAVNDELDGSPELVNSDPYGAGWLIKISVGPGVGALMSADAYERLVQEEEG